MGISERMGRVEETLVRNGNEKIVHKLCINRRQVNGHLGHLNITVGKKEALRKTSCVTCSGGVSDWTLFIHSRGINHLLDI